jgi:superfamily II DNA or RNA helicase
MSDIHLLEYQKSHVKLLHSYFNTRNFAFDFSLMGSGKTFTSTRLAFERNLKHVLVLCPTSVIPKWTAMRKLARDVPFRNIISFQSLRSTTFHQPKHGLLHRFEQPSALLTRLGSSSPEFSTTSLYKSYVEEGLLLIVDEVQNIKNYSSQYLAAKELITEIMHSTSSKVLMLSASPIDKREQAVRFFRSLGVLNRPLAYWNPQTYQMDWAGLNDVRDFCASVNERATLETPLRVAHEHSFENYVYRLFISVIKTHCSATMRVEKNPTLLNKYNAYYYIDKEGEEILLRGMSSLTSAARFEDGQVNFQGAEVSARISSVTRALQVIETGKITLFTRLVRKYAKEQPSCKLIVAVNFTETINDLKNFLVDLNPLVLQGACSVKQRESVLEQFAEPSLKHRLLLCNQGVASTGIDLDDKDGRFPRVCLVSPNYSSITAFQLGHRFHRIDTKSDATVHFVFALRKDKNPSQCGDIIELKVLDALSRKSEVMRATCDMEMIPDVQFPGEHKEFIESSACHVF